MELDMGDDYKDLMNDIAERLGAKDADSLRVELEFVRLLIQERADRKAMWERVRSTIIGWLVIGVLTGVGTLGYHVFVFITRNWNAIAGIKQ